jgi:hypothetical protein
MRTEDYTYVYRLYEADELYDRSADPNETNNIAADHEALVATFKADVLEWLFSTADVIPWATDPRFPKIPQGQHTDF